MYYPCYRCNVWLMSTIASQKKSFVSSSDPTGSIYWSWVLWAIASDYSLCYTIQKDKPLTFQYTILCNIKVFISSHMHKTSTKHIPLPVLCVWKALTGTNTIINKVISECKPVSCSCPDIFYRVFSISILLSSVAGWCGFIKFQLCWKKP